MGQKNIFVRRLIAMKVSMVAISQGLRDLYIKLGVPREKILVAADGVDLDKFKTQISKSEAREELGLDKDKKLIIYTGSRQPWKGVETLEKAAELITDAEVLIVSGKSPKDIPLYLRAADVLVLPNTAKEEISRLYTSPMKLFEYMASSRPIIASDIPSLREIVDDSMVNFFTPDDSADLSRVIASTFDNYDDALTKADKSLKIVQNYSWQRRARAIMESIK